MDKLVQDPTTKIKLVFNYDIGTKGQKREKPLIGLKVNREGTPEFILDEHEIKAMYKLIKKAKRYV